MLVAPTITRSRKEGVRWRPGLAEWEEEEGRQRTTKDRDGAEGVGFIHVAS